MEEPNESTPLSRDGSPAPFSKSLRTPAEHESLIVPLSTIARAFSPPEGLEDDEVVGRDDLTLIKRGLFVSHFLSTWNARGFEFGAILLLAAIFLGDLLPMSLYALGRAASTILLAPTVGRYINTSERLQAIRRSILWQRSAVLVPCALFAILSSFKSGFGVWIRFLLLGATTLLACVEKLYAVLNMVSVERDWVVVISNSDESLLQRLNSQMRRIDLFCKLVSPLVISLLDECATSIAIVVTLGANAISMPTEYILIAQVYHKVPALARHHDRGEGSSRIDDEQHQNQTSHQERRMHTSLWSNLKTYASQSAFPTSLSLSILYLTVLSFAGQMVTYLLAMGYTSTMVRATPSAVHWFRIIRHFCRANAHVSHWSSTIRHLVFELADSLSHSCGCNLLDHRSPLLVCHRSCRRYHPLPDRALGLRPLRSSHHPRRSRTRTPRGVLDDRGSTAELFRTMCLRLDYLLSQT